MTMTTSRRRATLIAAALGLVLLMTLFFPGSMPWSPATENDAAADTPEGACGVHYYALDSPKESPYAFGPAVTTTDETATKAELRERRLCGTDLLGDPTLTAAHYAEWSSNGLTSQKVEFAGIDAFAARLVADFPLWESVVTEMEALENASAYSVTDVPAGTPSLYMVPVGAGVTTHQGLTVGNGTAVAFTHPSGAVVKFRLECGFQNVRTGFPPDVPPLPPTTPPTTPPPTCPPETPHGEWPVCKDDPIRDPENQGNNKPGGGGQAPPQTDPVGPPAAGTPPVVYTPPPVAPPVTTPPVGSTPDPAPAPAPEPEAPAPSAPAEGCSPPPGMATC